MQEHFAKQAEELLNAAQDIKVPENFVAAAEEGLAKSHKAYKALTGIAKDAGKAYDQVTKVANKGTKQFGDKVAETFEVNANAVFNTAFAIVRAKSFQEAAQLHTDFVQEHANRVGEQTKALYELGSKVAKDTAEAVNTAGTKTLEQLKAIN